MEGCRRGTSVPAPLFGSLQALPGQWSGLIIPLSLGLGFFDGTIEQVGAVEFWGWFSHCVFRGQRLNTHTSGLSGGAKRLTLWRRAV